MNGREVLAEIKKHPDLRHIPVVVLTTSSAEEDVLSAYDLHANCYITKPVDLDQFVKVVQSIEDFWLTIVRLPGDAG
jgi:chemotaxis family two-component system response regulator Rcp1